MDLIVLASCSGADFLVLFVWYEERAPSPMLPLGLFRSPVFSGANAITFLLYFALGGILFFLPFNLIQSRLFGDARRRRVPALHSDHGWVVSLVRRAHPSLWRAKAPDDRPCHRGRRVQHCSRSQALADPIGRRLPGDGGAGSRHGHQRGPAHHDRHGRSRSQYCGTASGINNAISRIAGMLAIALLGALVVGVFGVTLNTRLAELQVPAEIRRALNAEVPKFAEAKVPPQIEGEQRLMLE